MYVLYKNQFICNKAESGDLEVCFSLSEDFTEASVQHALIAEYAETDLFPVQTFAVGDCEILWIFDKGNSDAAKMKDNNLLAFGKDESGALLPIWNMKDTVNFADCCVAVAVDEEAQTFSFNIFAGKRFTMKVTGCTVELADSRITK